MERSRPETREISPESCGLVFSSGRTLWNGRPGVRSSYHSFTGQGVDAASKETSFPLDISELVECTGMFMPVGSPCMPGYIPVIHPLIESLASTPTILPPIPWRRTSHFKSNVLRFVLLDLQLRAIAFHLRNNERRPRFLTGQNVRETCLWDIDGQDAGLD